MLFLYLPDEDFSLTIEQLINDKLHFLQQHGIETSKFELRMLLGFVLDLDVNALYFYKFPLNKEQLAAFEYLVKQRLDGWPVDKIIGQKGFYKYDFIVNRDVLSPRPDTEVLVEKALLLLKSDQPQKILEFGIGSGCILLSLLAEIPYAAGVGIDISAKALSVAASNAEKLGVASRLTLREISWFDANIRDMPEKDFDMIVSNPPYIPSGDIAKLDREVKDFDPLTALDGGADGLRDYRQIAYLAGSLLKKDGFLLFEGGIGQAHEIADIGKSNGFDLIDIVEDLNHIERCIILKK